MNYVKDFVSVPVKKYNVYIFLSVIFTFYSESLLKLFDDDKKIVHKNSPRQADSQINRNWNYQSKQSDPLVHSLPIF